MTQHKNKLSKALGALVLPTLLLPAMLLGSCSDNDDITNPDGPYTQVGRYAYSLRDTQDSLSVVFDGVTADVVRVESPFSWLNIAADGKDDQGNTRVSIVRTDDTPDGFEADSAQVILTGSNAVRLVINGQEEIRPAANNDGVYDAFNTSWWTQETVSYRETVYVNGQKKVTEEPIPLPWATATSSQIPTSLIQNDGVTPERGWTMAYNLFDGSVNGSPKSFPYFMLYNKYTGVLRVFYYQRNDVGTGGELSFVVTPDMPKTPKFPYYNSLQYAIPVCNAGILEKGNVLNIVKTNQGKCAFQQQITPYLKSSVTLQKGWYCFDLDWSAYNPAQTNPFRANDRFSIDLHTSSNATMTLNGAITATASGKIEGLGNTSTSSSSSTTLLEDVWSQKANIAAGITAIYQGKYLTALKKGWSVLYTLGKGIYKRASTNPYDEPEEIEDHTGEVNLNFTGQISLSGYINSNTSNNAESVEFSYNSFQQNDTVGVGVWSLQENPVVYVVNDVLLGEYDSFTCLPTSSDYTVGTEDPAPNNLRLFTFFDPTSIKINLNTKAFKDVRNVKMTWTYGVYPNQTYGHTDIYRKSFLGLNVASPIFIDHTSANTKKFYNSKKSKFANMTYVQFPLADQTMTKLATSDRPSFYTQTGGAHRLYGCAGNEESTSSKDFFIVDPAVFLPTNCVNVDKETQLGTGKLYDFQTPDFIVGVIITFDYTRDDGKPAQGCFSKRFVPEVKSIDRAGMLQKRAELETYVNSGVHQTIGDGIEVKHAEAATLLGGFFSTSSYLSNH